MMFCHFIWFLFGFFGDVFAVPSNVERTRIMMQIGQFQDDEEGGGVPKHHTDLERRLATVDRPPRSIDPAHEMSTRRCSHASTVLISTIYLLMFILAIRFRIDLNPYGFP